MFHKITNKKTATNLPELLNPQLQDNIYNREWNNQCLPIVIQCISLVGGVLSACHIQTFVTNLFETCWWHQIQTGSTQYFKKQRKTDENNSLLNVLALVL